MASIGRRQVVGLGLQGSRGTAAAADYWIQKTGFEFNRASNHQVDDSALGVSADGQGVGVSQLSSAPTLSGYLDIASIGLFEWAASESYADTTNADVSGDVFNHTSKGGIGTQVDRLITLTVDDPSLELDQSVADAMMNSYTISVNTSERVTFETEWYGKYPASATHVPAFTTPTNFFGKHVTVKTASAVSGLAAATAVPLKSVGFTRTFNLNNDDNSFNLGNVAPVDHHKQEFATELSLSKYLENKTYIDFMEVGGTYALEVRVIDTTKTIGTAANPTIVWTFPKVSFQSTTGGDNPSLRTEDLTLKVHYGVDNVEEASYQWKSVVTNLVADYEA